MPFDRQGGNPIRLTYASSLGPSAFDRPPPSVFCRVALRLTLRFEVTVMLSPVDFIDDFPSRVFSLTPDKPTLAIGRSSKKGSGEYCAAHDNAYIDSPVVSRQHAQFQIVGPNVSGLHAYCLNACVKAFTHIFIGALFGRLGFSARYSSRQCSSEEGCPLCLQFRCCCYIWQHGYAWPWFVHSRSSPYSAVPLPC
jgi:hypothetical protein